MPVTMASIVADGVTPRYSLPQIGRYFSRDHTTVIHACKRHLERTT